MRYQRHQHVVCNHRKSWLLQTGLVPAPTIRQARGVPSRLGCVRYLCCDGTVIDVLNLALPYFGLIFLGFASGRMTRIPVQGLAWMDFFILYMTLPALFYRILAKTPFEQLSNVRFIATATLSTFLVLMLLLSIGWLIRRDLAESAIGQLAGAYGNIGYMGPSL